jgi:hypothetical protein
MKKILLILAACVLAFTCNAQKFSSKGTKEKKFVGTFISYMQSGPDYAKLMDCISPEYIRKNGIEESKFKVDNYQVWGYSLESYSRDGLVTLKIWGDKRSWVHQLTFKLSKEKGKLYIVPSAFTHDYISPWWERKAYIKED